MSANLEHSAVATGLEQVSFLSSPKEGQCQRTFKLLYNCTHFTWQQDNAQNPTSQASAVCELNGHKFEQTPGDSGGQRSLSCCSSIRPQRFGHNLATKQQQQQYHETGNAYQYMCSFWAYFCVYTLLHIDLDTDICILTCVDCYTLQIVTLMCIQDHS